MSLCVQAEGSLRFTIDLKRLLRAPQAWRCDTPSRGCEVWIYLPKAMSVSAGEAQATLVHEKVWCFQLPDVPMAGSTLQIKW